MFYVLLSTDVFCPRHKQQKKESSHNKNKTETTPNTLWQRRQCCACPCVLFWNISVLLWADCQKYLKTSLWLACVCCVWLPFLFWPTICSASFDVRFLLAISELQRRRCIHSSLAYIHAHDLHSYAACCVSSRSGVALTESGFFFGVQLLFPDIILHQWHCSNQILIRYTSQPGVLTPESICALQSRTFSYLTESSRTTVYSNGSSTCDTAYKGLVARSVFARPAPAPPPLHAPLRTRPYTLQSLTLNTTNLTPSSIATLRTTRTTKTGETSKASPEHHAECAPSDRPGVRRCHRCSAWWAYDLDSHARCCSLVCMHMVWYAFKYNSRVGMSCRADAFCRSRAFFF